MLDVSDTIARLAKTMSEAEPIPIEKVEIGDVVDIALYCMSVDIDKKTEFEKIMHEYNIDIIARPGFSMFAFEDEETQDAAQHIWKTYLENKKA